MTAPPGNSDEDYYVDESFDEDSQSEVEVEEEQEDEEAAHGQLEESDTQSESDVEAEFLRGNVSQLQEITIKQFSLDPKANALSNPQPHARRQQLYGGRTAGGGGGFNRDRRQVYPSSSSDDESQVVITKTVAEVNQLSIPMESAAEDDETLSVRTLKPGSAHLSAKHEEIEDEEVEEDDEEVLSDATVDNNINDEDDDAESVEEEEQEESDDDEKTDVEIDHLEYDEDEDDNDHVIQGNLPQTNLVTVADASDNSSDRSAPVRKIQQSLENISLYSAGNETEETLVQSSKHSFSSREEMPEPETNTETDQETKPDSHTQFNPGLDLKMPQLEDFLNDGAMKPDTAAVKYLEQKMTQMSEIIMKTFRTNGGTSNSLALEQLARATEIMQSHVQKLEEDSECTSDTGSSALASARSCGGMGQPQPLILNSSQEGFSTVRPTKIPRSKCRCPSIANSIPEDEVQPGMELQMDPFLMDECGQGDGLMRHNPYQQHELNSRMSNVTPSSYSGDQCGGYHMDGGRPRSSTDKVNYKNLGRKSFSFSNYQVREIERQNQILLKKMMTVKATAPIKASTSSVKCSTNMASKTKAPPAPRLSSAAINRKKYQRQIDLDNDVLKRKLEAIGTRRTQFK